jgi:hypothetical protein
MREKAVVVGSLDQDRDLPGTKRKGRAAELAARMFSGVEPTDISLMQRPLADARSDWRQLRRWNIPESVFRPARSSGVDSQQPGHAT